jgi:hypothetical protein
VFIRFSVRKRDRDSGVESGALQAAYGLRDDPSVPIGDREALAETLLWFETHLETPARFNRTTSKGHYRRQTRGIAWFKDTANEHLAQMYALKVLLERYGHFVEVVKEPRVGYIVWEDAYQVIAEPFTDTRTG